MTRPHLTLITGALLTLCTSLASAGEAIVIDSSTDEYEEGQVLGSSQKVLLKKGVRVRLLLENGTVLHLEGPHKGAISEVHAPNGQSVIRSIARLFVSDAKGKSVMAAFRRAPVEPIGPWVIDVTLPGHHCVRQGMKTLMWRPKNTVTDRLELAGTGGEKSVQDWPRYSSTLDWPTSIQLSDGEIYSADLLRAKTITKFTIHVVPDEFATESHRVAWMSDVRCDAQARQLLNQID
jgi:hypothetical protein